MDGGRIGTITTDGAMIKEFPLPSGHEPAGLTLGPDGFIWFSDIVTGGDQIGRVTPQGVISETNTPSSPAMPASIVKARDGSLFFVETSANKIARIAAPASVFAASAPLASAAVASAPATAAAASAAAGSGFTEYPIPTAGAGAVGMALGSDGNLWFTENLVDKIGKLDVTTGVVTEFALPTTNARASGIVAGPDCNLWFVENNANLIGQVTTAGAITEFKPSAGSDPTGITVGADGNLWYTETDPGKLAMLPVSSQACPDHNLPPVAHCQNTTVNTDAGACSAATASINDGSFDPDGNLVSTVQTPAGNFSLGNTAATLTLTDSDAAVSSCDGQVTVQDKQAPTLSCGAPMVECTSPAGAAVTLSAAASDNCPGTLTPICSPASGKFPLGPTSFTCSVLDGSGNSGSCTLHGNGERYDPAGDWVDYGQSRRHLAPQP